MYAWEAVQETVEYLEKHYEEEIQIDRLVEIAHLSPYYLQRLFHRLVGKTIYEYLKLRRLAKSFKLLKEGQETILQIALAVGFKSHETFTKAFKEVYGITPSQYRKGDMKLDPFSKPELLLQYTMIDTDVPLVCNSMVLEIFPKTMETEILFIGKTKKSIVSEIGTPKVNDLAMLWEELGQEQKMLAKELEVGVGADILLPNENPEYFTYIAALETNQEVPGYDSWRMPIGEYIVCRYEAEDFDTLVGEALYKASQYVFEKWLPQHQVQPEPFIVQKYYRPMEEDCYIELWIKIAK